MHHIAIVKIHNGEINAQFGAMSDWQQEWMSVSKRFVKLLLYYTFKDEEKNLLIWIVQSTNQDKYPIQLTTLYSLS